MSKLNTMAAGLNVNSKIMHLSSASPRGGTRADVGTLLIVHFKVLVFPYL